MEKKGVGARVWEDKGEENESKEKMGDDRNRKER